MIRFARLGLIAAVLGASGCAGRIVETEAPAHGNLLAAALARSEKAAKHRAPLEGAPLVVMVEQRAVRAVDPTTADIRWTRSLRVHGHPVASRSTLYVPISGHRLVALDRRTGQTRWEATLPGEALTGMAVAEPFVVVSVIDHRKGRSRLAGISARDGQVRWLRRSALRFGVPAATGNLALVSHGRQVIAFGAGTGRERARLDLAAQFESSTGPGAPALERLAVARRSLLAGEGVQWVDLATSIGSRIEAIQTVDDQYAAVFAAVQGLDPGHADAERLRLWVEFAPSADAPRSAVLLCRRAIVSMRLSPGGRAAVAQWAHRSVGDQEYVAMRVGETEVVAVREDGRIVVLDRASGRVVDAIAGGDPVRGALILGERPAAERAAPAPERPEIRGMLVALLDDTDPRLLPAQRLAIDLLWRDEEPAARDVVDELARARRRGEHTRAAVVLREYALDRVAGPWGRPDAPERTAMTDALAARPSFLEDQRPPIAVLARQAVASGDLTLVGHLVDHLLHPGTAAADLPEVVTALVRIGRPEAVLGLATFVRRYHADPQVVNESPAVLRAITGLLELTHDQSASADIALTARAALQDVADDPFTDGSLRGYIAGRLAPTRGDEGADEPPDAERPPRLTALSDPGL